MDKNYEEFHASLLYCTRCGQAMPVHERLLLVLPTGNLYDYRCKGCGQSLGSKTEKSQTELKSP